MTTLQEISYVRALRDRELWYEGERLGYDPRLDSRALRKVEIRVAEIILGGYGKELRESNT